MESRAASGPPGGAASTRASSVTGRCWMPGRGGPRGDPGQVRLAAVQQSGALPGRGGGAEVQGDARMLAAEGQDRPGREVPDPDAAGGDADRAAAAVAELAELAERGAEGGDTAGRRLVEDPPGWCRRDTAGLALDQDQAGLFFQAPDVRADR